MERRTMIVGLQYGGTALLAAATIMGGLLMWGRTGVIIAVFIGIGVGVFTIWLKRRSQVQIALVSFQYPRPSWLSDETADHVYQLVKAALLCLILDRSDSGCWGITYLYRRVKSSTGMPLAGGSLTGTPLSIVAISSCVSNDAAREWLYTPLSQTLASILTADGQYRHGETVATVSPKVESFEPLRHAAGGCLTKLLFDQFSPSDIKTMETLCTAPLGPMAWDKAIVATTLFAATRIHRLPRQLRRRASNRSKTIIAELMRAANDGTPTQIWSNAYRYGIDVNNQWATVWALLLLMRAYNSHPRSLSIKDILRKFLLAQAASEPSGRKLLPSGYSKTGLPAGEHVLGTTIAFVAWRTLELAVESGAENHDLDSATGAQLMLSRLLQSSSRLIELPSQIREGDDLTLEGYFAWAGICLAAASLGVLVSGEDWRSIVDTAEQIRMCEASRGLDSLRAAYAGIIGRSSCSSQDFAPSIVDVATQIASFRREISSSDATNS